jgi:transketolase
MNQPMRFKAAGWDVQRVDGHDCDAVAAAIEKARKSSQAFADRLPDRHIGKGAPNMQGSHKTHGAPLGCRERSLRPRKHLGWHLRRSRFPPTSNPHGKALPRAAGEPSGNSGRIGTRPRAAGTNSTGRRVLHGSASRQGFPAAGRLPKGASQEKATKVATRQASQMVLEVSMN